MAYPSESAFAGLTRWPVVMSVASSPNARCNAKPGIGSQEGRRRTRPSRSQNRIASFGGWNFEGLRVGILAGLVRIIHERFCCHRQCLGERPGAGPTFLRILETVVFSMGMVPRARCSFAFRLPLPRPLLPLSNLGRGHLPDEIIAVSRRVRVSVSCCQAIPHVGLD